MDIFARMRIKTDMARALLFDCVDARASTVMAPTTDALYDFIGKAEEKPTSLESFC